MPLQIIQPGTEIDFISKWRPCLAISCLVILLGVAGIFVRGFRMGVDFKGGYELQVSFAETQQVDEGTIRDVVQSVGIAGASVVRYGPAGSREFLIKFKGAAEETPPVAAGEAEIAAAAAAAAEADEKDAPADAEAGLSPNAVSNSQVRTAVDGLVAALGERIGPVELARVEFVGPKVGAELRRAGVMSLSIACLLILVYIAFRFSTRFAPGAVVALVHDVLITSSIWVLLGLEFDLKVLAALLAIIGYSLNDTIIVYDRVRENMELSTKRDLEQVLNRSVNQTLSRTLLTSLTTMITVLCLLFLGGEVIRPFALAMAIGIVVGTYSSIYVAGPTLLFLEHRFGEPVK